MNFRKDDSGKLLYNLLPPRELQQVVEVLTTGADKYGFKTATKTHAI